MVACWDAVVRIEGKIGERHVSVWQNQDNRDRLLARGIVVMGHASGVTNVNDDDVRT